MRRGFTLLSDSRPWPRNSVGNRSETCRETLASGWNRSPLSSPKRSVWCSTPRGRGHSPLRAAPSPRRDRPRCGLPGRRRRPRTPPSHPRAPRRLAAAGSSSGWGGLHACMAVPRDVLSRSSNATFHVKSCPFNHYRQSQDKRQHREPHPGTSVLGANSGTRSVRTKKTETLATSRAKSTTKAAPDRCRRRIPPGAPSMPGQPQQHMHRRPVRRVPLSSWSLYVSVLNHQVCPQDFAQPGCHLAAGSDQKGRGTGTMLLTQIINSPQ